MNATDGLRQDQADVDCFNLWTLELLQLVGNRVRHHNLMGDDKGDVRQNAGKQDIRA